MNASPDGRTGAHGPGPTGEPTALVAQDGPYVPDDGGTGDGMGGCGAGDGGTGDGVGGCGAGDGAGEPGAPDGPSARLDLLDSVADWPATPTTAGTFRLEPVRLDRDLRLIAAWMNDPAVAAFWELAGPQEITAAHIRPQLEGDGRSVPCLGVLDGVPMSYWEIYRADLDTLARHVRTLPHDTGLHLLIGGVPDRGRGVGTALLRAAAELVLRSRPRCERVLAEPDVRNIASVAAFLSAGFRLSAEVELPDKRAALMVRDRTPHEEL